MNYKFKLKKILGSEIIKIKLPRLLKKNDSRLFKNELLRKINDVYIYNFQNIYLNNNSIPLVFKKEIFTDFLKFKSLGKFKFFKKIFLLIYFLSMFLKNKKKTVLKKNLIIIHDRHSDNYFHWITDVLPKILWLKEKNNLDTKKIFLPNFKNNFQKDTLRLVTKDYETSKQNKNILINNGYYIPEFHPSGCPRLKYLLQTKNFFLNKFKCKHGNQKIYISRNKSKRRKLINERELISKLRKRDFKIVYMENLSFKQQVIQSAKSKLIVSLHGAGLTNLIWMKINSKTIEIRDPDDIYLNPFYVLCQRLGIEYNYFLTKKKFLNKINPHNDYEIDVNTFIENYEKLLSS